MNRARRAKQAGTDVTPSAGVTFVGDMMKRLRLSETSVERLITLGNRIPRPVLKAVTARDGLMRATGKGIKSLPALLDLLASAFKPKMPPPDWQRIIEQHISPPQYRGDGLLGGVHLGGPYFFLGEDSRRHLEGLVAGGHQFDAAILDPPYGTNLPRRVGGMMVDDQKGALWAVPLLAKLVKPGGVIGIWCTGSTLGRWVNALLGEHLTIVQWVMWNKQSAWQAERGDEVMLVAGHGIPTSYGPPLYEVAHPGYSPTAPERQQHPTPKPPELFDDIIERWTKPGDVVLDAFAGLAPLGVACLKHGRQYWGFEIAPEYAAVALKNLREASPTPKRRRVVTDEDRAEWDRLFDAQQARRQPAE